MIYHAIGRRPSQQLILEWLQNTFSERHRVEHDAGEHCPEVHLITSLTLQMYSSDGQLDTS